MLNFDRFYRRWNLFHAIWNLSSIYSMLQFGMSHLVWTAGNALFFLAFTLKAPRFLFTNQGKVNYANIITSFRLVLVLFVSGCFHVLSSYTIFTILLLAIILDGVDGYVARKFKTESDIGETFDMEVDAFLVLLMSYLHFLNPELKHSLFLLAGSMKYIYSLITMFIPKHSNDELLPKRVRSSIAVIFFIALIVPFIIKQSSINTWVLLISSALILMSFGISLVGILYQSYFKKQA